MIDITASAAAGEAYVPPDVARIGTVEELTEGVQFTLSAGDLTSLIG